MHAASKRGANCGGGGPDRPGEEGGGGRARAAGAGAGAAHDEVASEQTRARKGMHALGT